MIRIAVLGDIGSGKSYVANLFGYPVFNADNEVAKLYKKSKKCFKNLRKKLPKYIKSFPVKKEEISNAIFANEINLKKIVKIIHPQIKISMKNFFKKNKNKKFIILDVPLFLENKMNKKKDILIFIESKKKEINKRLKKRKNFNQKLINKFRRIQLPVEKKKKYSNFTIKNNFNHILVKKNVKSLIKKFY